MRKIAAVFIIMMMLAGSMSILVGSAAYTENSTVHSVSPISPSTALSPTRINSNADFNTAHGVISGSGTILDPYIFDNWTIDGSGVGYGLYIGNTTAYFIIRNCTVQNANGVGSEPYFPDSNIVLYNVTHGMITNVTSTNAANNGIYLLGWSYGNTIYNNSVSNNGYGIVIYRANNSRIINNTVTSNSKDGIRIDTGYFNTIRNNTADNNGNSGIIFFKDCYNNRIKGNTLSNNRDGIKIEHSSYNIIENNNASSNTYKGIYLNYWCEHNRIMNNTANYNSGHDGITIYRSNNTVVINNTAVGNGRYGITIQYTNHTYMDKDMVINRNDALHLSNTRNTEIYGSTFDGMEAYYVISSQYDENLTIKNTSAGNSTLYVIYIEYGKNIIIDNSRISNDTRYHGIVARNSENLSISNSTIWNIYQHGIDIMAVRNYTVENNTFSDCHLVSIDIGYNYNTITRVSNNTITGSYVGILVGAQNSLVRDNTMFNTGILMTSWDVNIRMYNNTVNGNPVFYAYDTANLIVPPGMGEIILNHCDYFTIEEQNLSDGTVGAQIYQSHHGIIRNNTVLNNHMYGIWSWLSNYCEIYGNTISNSSEYDTGISSTMGSALYVAYTRYGSIHDNEISNSRVGVYIDYMSNSNTFQNNTLTNNGFFVYYYSTYSLDNDISLSNTVNGLPVYYLYNQNGTSVPPNSAGQVIIADSTNISVGAQSIHDSTVGMEIIWSSDISADGVHIQRESKFGVVSVRSSRLSVENSSVGNLSVNAIMGYYSDNLTVRGCAFSDLHTSYYAIDISYSPDALIDSCTFSNVYRGITARYSIDRARISGNNINVTSGDGIFVGANLNTNSHVLIEKNHIHKTGGRSYEGIFLSALNGTEMMGNTVTGFYHGLYLSSCYGADVHSNDFVNNTYGVYISRYSGYTPYIPSRIYHNNFIRNLAYPAYSPYNDIFNLTYPGGGNYYAYEYSFYNGVDYFSGPNQDMPGSDGFGDTPYIVTTGGSIDHYPLMFPHGSTPTYLANSSWPMFGHDMKHTGSTDVKGPITNTSYWAFPTSDSVYASVSIGHDGTIYVGSMDHRLYALNPDGTQKWNFTTAHNITSTPAIAQDGTIYFGSGIYLYALYPNGTEKWRYNVGDVKSSPVIGTDGTIYVGSDGGVFTAMNDDGTRRWVYNTGSVTPLTSPAIGTDGTIYFSNSTNVTYALSPSDGVLKWTWTHPGAANVSTPPLVLWNGTDDIIIIGFDDGNVSAIASNGTPLGGHTLDGKILGISSRGNEIYITTDNGTLYAVDYDNGPQWTFHADGAIEGSVAVDASGNIYFGTSGSTPRIYALDSSGNELWNYTVVYSLRSSPAIGDGVLFIGGDGGLYCMGDAIPPSVSISSPSEASVLSSGDVTITWSGNDTGSGIDHYEIRLDSGSWLNVGTSTQYAFSSLSDGAHTVYVMAVDKAGNTAKASVNFTVDTLAPEIIISSPQNGSYTNRTEIEMLWEGNDTGSGIDHYEIRLDSGSWLNVGSNTSHMFSGLEDGSHTVYARAFDNAGWNSTTNVSFGVDTVKPDVRITYPEEPYISPSSDLNIKWQGSDNESGISGYYVRTDSGAWSSAGMNTTYTLHGIEDGEHTVQVMAEDRAGNRRISEVNFLTDTEPPEVSIDSPLNGSLHRANVEIIWHGEDTGSGIRQYALSLDGGDWVDVGMNTSYNFIGLSDGEHTVQLMALDGAGHGNTSSVSFFVDGTPPSIEEHLPVGSSLPVNSTIYLRFSEPIVRDTLKIRLMNGSTSVSGNIKWLNDTVVLFTPSSLDYGLTYTVTVSGVRDAAGNNMTDYSWSFSTTDKGLISGKVLDRNGNPVEDAKVTSDSGESTLTDSNGNFTIQLSMGEHVLTVSRDGYNNMSINVTVVPGHTKELPPMTLPESSSHSMPVSPGSFMYVILGLLLIVAFVIAALLFRRKRGVAEDDDELSGNIPEEAASFEDMEPNAADIAPEGEDEDL